MRSCAPMHRCPVHAPGKSYQEIGDRWAVGDHRAVGDHWAVAWRFRYEESRALQPASQADGTQ